MEEVEVSVFDIVNNDIAKEILKALDGCFGKGNYEIVADSILVLVNTKRLAN